MKYKTYLIALISLLLFVECNTNNNKQNKRKIKEEEFQDGIKQNERLKNDWLNNMRNKWGI